jgi:sulfur carrier protein
MIEIELNGVAHRVPPQHTLFDLVTELALADRKVALAVNRQVVPREQWPQRQLQTQDKVDIVRAIGGG